MKKIFIVIGTRPEIIKMSPLIPELKKQYNVEIIFTGQHYSKNLKDKIFDDLKLSQPKFNFSSKNTSSADQLGVMIRKVVKVLEVEKPDAVVVHGDTNTTLVGAISANKLNIPVIHIEAGARSGNKHEPEEINRMLVDQIATINFAFNDESVASLKKENITKNVYNFPNTAREAVKRNIKLADQSSVLKKLGIENEEFVLSTLHRATNTSDIKVVKKYLKLLEHISKDFVPVIAIHPRTEKLIKKAGIKVSSRIKIIKPVGYLDFLKLESCASYILSDSGGVVDEALTLNTPLIIFRNETERLDALKTKKCILVRPKECISKIKSEVDLFTQKANLVSVGKFKTGIKIDSSNSIVKAIKKII